MKKPTPRRAPSRALLRVTPVAAAAAAVALCALPSQALAQQSDTQAAAAEVITITGIRRGIESAINVKKNSDSIVEAISAEDLGKLPDTSVAESIARLPGVAAQRTAGRAQQISIRGLGPDFATGLLNGREQVSTGDSRGVDFDQYPSELLSAVVIYKTPDAALLGQGLSGTVDMQTVRPLNLSQRAIAVGARETRSGYGLPGEHGKAHRYTLSYVDQFADRTFGVALGFARFEENIPAVQRFESWGIADTCPVALVNNACAVATVKTPGGFNAFTDTQKGTRDGFMGVLEWRPNKNFRSTLDIFSSKFETTKLIQGFQAPIGYNSAGGYDPGNATLGNATIANGVASAGTFNLFKGVVRIDSNAITDKLDSYGWKNELKLGEWSGVLDLSQSKGRKTGGIIESTAGQPGNGNVGGGTDTISWTGFDGASVQNARYTTGLDYTNRAVVKLTDVQGWGGNINAAGQSTTPQAGYSKLPHVDDKIDAVRLSARRDLPEGLFFSNVDFGLAYTDREKKRAYIEGRLIVGPANQPFAAADMPGSGTAVAGQTGIQVAAWDPTGSVGSVYTVAAKLVRDIANKDWTVSEKVTTAFAKMDLDRELFGIPVRGNAGLQLVNTNQGSVAFNVDGGPCPNDVCPVTNVGSGAKYNDILPSANLAFELSGDQRVRVGLARVLARPTVDDMRASLGFGVDANGGGTNVPMLTGNSGNPQLKPFRANTLDVAYEKYFGGTKGYVGAAAFYKQLSTYIVRASEPFDFTPYVTPGTTPLPGNGPNAGRAFGLLSHPVNGSGGSMSGIELAASLPFGMFVSAADGFGLQASYAHTTSSVRLPTTGFNVNGEINTPDIPLPGLSKDVYGMTLYFEKWGFQARAAARHRSDFVGEVTNILGDRNLTYVKGETIVDWQIGYEVQSGFAKGLSVLFQVLNATNAEYVRYRDVPSNEVERTKYGKTYQLGLNYRL